MRQGLTRLIAGTFSLFLSLGAVAMAEEAGHLTAGDVLHGRFTQERYLTGFEAPLKSTGQFVLAPGRGLIWRVEQPFAVSTAMTDKGVAQFNGEVEMMRVNAAQAPFVTHMFTVLGGALSGNLTALERYFQVTTAEDETGWHLLLMPLDAEMAGTMQLSSIEVDGSRFVELVTITRASGDKDVIRFAEQNVDQKLAPADDAMFQRIDGK